MVKAEKEDIVNLTLPQIIHKKLKSKLSFEELENFDKGLIIKYIYDNNIQLKIFEKNGYDIIKKSFFAIEYVYRYDMPRYYDVERKYFANFEAFFEYVQGNIYGSSCYYGYVFSTEEIKKYNIDISRLNFDAFINYDITRKTFETLLEEKKEKTQENVEKGIRIRKWISKIDGIDSYESLMKKYRYYKSRFTSFKSERIFFSLIIQKFGDLIKDYLVEFRRKNNPYSGLDVEDIAFYYGVDTAEQVLTDFDGGCWTDSTRNKHKKKIKEKLQLIKEGKLTVQKRGTFSVSDQLFIVNYLYFEDGKRYESLSVEKYLLSFDDFIKELDGDLFNVNLENAPLDISEILKYKVNENTILPKSNTYNSYKVKKYYKDGKFYVVQIWLDKEENVVLINKEEFKFFCDFVYYLNNDLSKANLIMCEGIENIS